ncbi:TniQ family protein [Niallia sp. HCP3S3_B10]|uniref:TniQ family protein n=1 Tax=Niallia sp. HCP3S3_B10 TaxID=3438944 RepID=UPI003F8A9A96
MNSLIESLRKSENPLGDFLSSRTVLYNNIEPIGIGTPYIESLTSYICRIAKSHNVRVTTLLNELIGSYIGLPYLADAFAKNLAPNRYNLINGISTINIEFIKVLEKLTGRNDIEHMTFKNWKGILSNNIVSKNRRWCPLCLNYLKKESREIYEPLIWLVPSINKCEIHSTRIKEECPNCNKKLGFVHRNLIVGYCQYCSGWLGEDGDSISNDPLTNDEHFVIKNYKQLMEQGPKLTSFPSRNFMSLILPKIKDDLGFEYLLDFAGFLDVRYITLIDWIKNKHIPNPASLLTICSKLNYTIFDLINLSNKSSNKINNNIILKVETKISMEELRKHLLKEIAKDTPRSLNQVCKDLRITGKFAGYYFPELCEKIVSRFSSYKRDFDSKRFKKTEEILNNALAEDIPESLNKTLSEHDISYKTAKRYHPILCEKISLKYKEYYSEKKNQNIEEMKVRIESVILELHKEGIYPSVGNISKKLSLKNANLFRQTVFNDFRKSILLSLGYRNSHLAPNSDLENI